MGLDFWAVKLKKGLKKEDFNFKSHWDLVEEYEIDEFLDQETLDFVKRWNDKDLYRFCKDTVGFFVDGDAISINSKKDINILADKLNIFINENPDYVYKDNDFIIYSNEQIRMFIKYINIVRDNDFVLWCSC